MPVIKPINEIIQEISPYYQKKKKPETEHTLIYDSSSETLEPLYFFILDLMRDNGFSVEKLVDNFTSTAGSGHFAEMGQRATRMQEEGMKIFGVINTVLRSVLNLVYDLRDFRTRMDAYNLLKSKSEVDRTSAILSLKQIWLDKVDFTAKGNSSIKVMALGQAGYQTLIDAFLVANNPEEVEKLDLNERVKRILKPRIYEFNIWVSQSEKELKKRYELERTYLRSQVNSLKIYSRWLRPYLRASADLEMGEAGKNPDLVKTFSTTIFGLTLLGKSEIKVDEAAAVGDFPKELPKMKLKRKYYSCILIDFEFRSIPQRVGQQNYVFGGKAKVTFRGYALNEDELKKLEQELNKSDLEDLMGFIEGASGESMKQLQEEVEDFLDEKPDEDSDKKESNNVNPFLALFGFYNKSSPEKERKSNSKEKEKIIEIKLDDWLEKTHLRAYAAKTSKEKTFLLFDVYKKAHQMPSYT